MSELIVYCGGDPIVVTPTAKQCYLYRIGVGQVQGGPFIDLNDAARLNEIAEAIRDPYSEWVYALNTRFIDSNLMTDGLSLFFLTDLSCKRSEFFQTFDLICGLILLRERVSEIQLARVRLIGMSSAFLLAFESVFPSVLIKNEDPAKTFSSVSRRLAADNLFLWRAFGVSVLNLFTPRSRKKSVGGGRVFFSIYPQMFDSEMHETKYGSLVDDEAQLAVTVLADGMHQKVSFGQVIRLSRAAEYKGIQVIDRDLRCFDIYRALGWATRLWIWYAGQRGDSYEFKEIDVSGFVRGELRFSISRVIRLVMLKGSVARFLQRCRPDELYYYPVEYPLGRMISWAATLVSPNIKRIGFQMGIVSKRRLEQFMALGEASTKPPYRDHAPIPDKVLAEDHIAASIYRNAGYQNVSIMEKVYRYEYLEEIQPRRRSGWCLIAPGLHDGAVMLEQLAVEINRHPDKTWVVKPHPRGDNQYLEQWSTRDNLHISERTVAELLAEVSEVFVTYSSVGLEARQLGLKVTVISIPGRINASPLLDIID